MQPIPANPSSARIYVLWHPGFDSPDEFQGRAPAQLNEDEKKRLDRGIQLARTLYYWFRLENMEGIPVYFRSLGADGGRNSRPLKIDNDPGVLNYIIPLVDAHMVSSHVWRAYVADYAALDGKTEEGSQYRVLPVAMDTLAYNMPESMRKLNFIRHVSCEDDQELIAKLTEVLCRDLRSRLAKHNGSETPVPGKIKIFLSHAKADDTTEAVALKECIQRETQCEAFFDETDIASGYDYENVLKAAIEQESAGLIVVQGDHYADRPWCRKEIRDFLNPVQDPLGDSAKNNLYFIPPVVVVQIMKGKQIARTIPELGHAPCVRWQDNKARFVVTTLLREILFGLFYRMLAQQHARDETNLDHVFINRPPDPVMVNRILGKREDSQRPKKFIHPGYGLSKMEKEGLSASFPRIDFESFLGRFADSTPPEFDLERQVIAISVGNSTDILAQGAADEHIQELLVRLLRPLLLKNASILYGGTMPDYKNAGEPWRWPINFTTVLLHLILTERASGQGVNAVSGRLYNPSFWPDSKKITTQLVAQWTDVCSFIKIPPEEAGIDLSPPPPAPVPPAEEEDLTSEERRKFKEDKKRAEKALAIKALADKARCLTAMRRKICQELECDLPDKPSKGEQHWKFRTFAHVFLGGKTSYSSGIMPGVFEEVLHAFKEHKPVFIMQEGRGAAGMIAGWLAKLPKERPKELTVEFYEEKDPNVATVRQELDRLVADGKGAGILTPAVAFDELWGYIQQAKTLDGLESLLKNGLSGAKNRELLTGSISSELCKAVWDGMKRLAESSPAPAALVESAPTESKTS